MLIPFNSFKGVVSVALDALVDSQHVQLNSIFVLLVQFIENVNHNGRIFAATGSDRDLVPLLEKSIVDDCFMHFSLKALEKALLADGRQVFRSLNKCFSLFADLASELGHLN